MTKKTLGILLVSMLASACSLITVEQSPFPALEITGKKPPPPPARVVLTDSAIVIKEKIQFAKGSAEILSESHGLLDEVAKVFKENEQIEQVQIEGHTDSDGSAKFNKKLSQSRAESVKAYLVKAGVADKRLVAMGFGLEKPIADNATEDGKEKNRRVEFNITKQGPKKTVVQED